MTTEYQHNPRTQSIVETVSSHLFTRENPSHQHPVFLAYDSPAEDRDPESLLGVYLARRAADFHLGIVESVRQSRRSRGARATAIKVEEFAEGALP